MPLTPDIARRVYDRVGARQDSQGWYEDAAIGRLMQLGRFDEGRRVLEFGCGTGRLARKLLDDRLPSAARYLGLDVSPVMVELARQTLSPWSERAEVRLVDGGPQLPVPDESQDHVVSTYVLDLLPEDLIRGVLAEAHRVLRPRGWLVAAGLTGPVTWLSGVVMPLWSVVHAVAPRLVGGCRPLRLRRFLDPDRWQLLEQCYVAPRGVASEVLVVEKRSSART